jgi:hypothetical protein
MSVQLVRDEIARFLARRDAEVLCVRGKWGVGKTYTWSKALEAAQQSSVIKLPRYSYVSLFGVNSLDELKFSIFENVITLDRGVRKADLETLDEFVSSKFSWRKWARLAQSVPIVRNAIGGDATSLVSFMTIRDQIVCIDDLERRGQNLQVNDVLGLISYLREQRDCKIVLILNDGMLEQEARRSFETNLEKVMDVSLAYEPSPKDSVKVGIPETDEVSNMIAEKCVALGIINIRVIKRIKCFVRAIQPLLEQFDKRVFEAALASIALFCWSHDQPEEAPSMNFLLSKTEDKFASRKKDEISPQEAAWKALLEAYGYTWTDKLDLELIRGIQAGYFNPEEIKRQAEAVHETIIASKADGSFEQAWRRYYDSFENDQDKVLDGLFEAFMRNVKYITPGNLSGTIALFRELGRDQQAREMLEHYMRSRQEQRAFYDLDNDPFGQISDPDVRAAFKQRFEALEERRDIKDMLLSLKDNWSPELISQLATLPAEDYYKIFKATSGDDLRRILSGIFQFDRIGNASDEMKEIPKRARLALQAIGRESPINKRRVGRFGVKVDD